MIVSSLRHLSCCDTWALDTVGKCGKPFNCSDQLLARGTYLLSEHVVVCRPAQCPRQRSMMRGSITPAAAASMQPAAAAARHGGFDHLRWDVETGNDTAGRLN